MPELDRDIVIRAGRYEWLFRQGSEIVKKDGATYILPAKEEKKIEKEKSIKLEKKDEQDS